MGILVSFVIALIVAVLFSPYKRGHSQMPLAIFFLVLFLSGLSAQFWVVPFGPVFYGVAWLRIFFIILVFALLFSSPPAHRKIPAANANQQTETPVLETIGAFIWILLLLLVISIVVGIFYSDNIIASQ
jgi:hypothetical protein